MSDWGRQISGKSAHSGEWGRQISGQSARGIARSEVATAMLEKFRRASTVNNMARKTSALSQDGFSRQVSERSQDEDGVWKRQLSEEEVEFHLEKTEIARTVLNKLMAAEDGSMFDKEDGSDGLGPPTADVPESHFNRRLLANEVLAATEDIMWDTKWNAPAPSRRQSSLDAASPANRKIQKAKSCVAMGYLGDEGRASYHPKIEEALNKAMEERSLLMKAAAFGEFERTKTPEEKQADATHERTISAPGKMAMTKKISMMRTRTTSFAQVRKDSAAFQKDSSLKSLKKPQRRASLLHDEVNQLLKTDGIENAKLTPPSAEKPVLKDPMGIRCVVHLHDPKWTKLARAIRETIYDPDFYDDGTYAPMYVRLAIHGAATWDQHTKTGGLEGGAMRYKPEYSDAHNKFCKEIVKRQHELLKVPFPWASYADIQCLCAYVALECANGPVMEFIPGRRDVVPPKDLKHGIEKPKDEEFVYLNYRERGDTGCEDEPVKCPASGKTGEDGDDGCPFLRKMRVFPGRVPGPEQGHLGKPCAPVTPEAEKKEMQEVAKEIRHIFCERIGASERHTVALIAGGHSLGRCHPQISGYAGPWQSNPGYFNNVYCKKLLTEDWKIVDRNMVDYSGDMITGLKPYGMRRQYVNKGGKGDLMMLVSDLALREDPYFGYWIQEYAMDNEKLKADFAAAFKWITEVGFEPPKAKRGLAKVLFNLRKWKADAMRWIGENICSAGDDGDDEVGEGGVMSDSGPKKGDPYTMDEVKAHTTKEDCWVVINGKVCNLTSFMAIHPGGEAVIMQKAGKDASSDWNAIHNKDAIEKIVPDAVIGYVVAKKDGDAGAGLPAAAVGA